MRKRRLEQEKIDPLSMQQREKTMEIQTIDESYERKAFE